jgi:hypothetical protein
MQSTLVGRYQTEAYATWIRRFCSDRSIPWRPEYATPLDGPKFGPLAQERQDKAIERMKAGKERAA